MRITPDTNVLVRALTEDDERQSKLAQSELANAEIVAVTLPALCELVWVLSRSYKVPLREIVTAIERLVAGENVLVDRPAVEAGLDIMRLGGDFADGVIAHAGSMIGSDAFVSFDEKAIDRLQARGKPARLPR